MHVHAVKALPIGALRLGRACCFCRLLMVLLKNKQQQEIFQSPYWAYSVKGLLLMLLLVLLPLLQLLQALPPLCCSRRFSCCCSFAAGASTYSTTPCFSAVHMLAGSYIPCYSGCQGHHALHKEGGSNSAQGLASLQLVLLALLMLLLPLLLVLLV